MPARSRARILTKTAGGWYGQCLIVVSLVGGARMVCDINTGIYERRALQTARMTSSEYAKARNIEETLTLICTRKLIQPAKLVRLDDYAVQSSGRPRAGLGTSWSSRQRR